MSDDCEAALELTQRILNRLVPIDGSLWKRTHEPLLKPRTSNSGAIDFDERDEAQFPDTRTDPLWVRYLPFCDHLAEPRKPRR